jgi:uncharacterized RDD family membrane protein YckC
MRATGEVLVDADVVEEVRYAGLVTRAIAIVIDTLLIDAIALVVTGAFLLIESVFHISNRHHGLGIIMGGVLFFVWVAAYFIGFWTTTGQTPGSRVMQIRVTRLDGTGLRPVRALLRLAWMVLSLPLFWGYLPVLWTPRRRAVCDFAAGTVVRIAEPAALPAATGVARRGLRAHGSGIDPPTTVP